MNKTVNINLGEQPFIIDEEAYERLSSYLERIENHFSYSEGCADIVEDIEMRMAELFAERLTNRSIVTSSDLDHVIEIMGRPEDLGCTEDYEGSGDKDSSAFDIRLGKKLFRDEENKVVGGVCSGLSVYLGIEDPIWVRLLFVFLIFGGGMSLLVYVILYLIMPAARSRQDYMAMKGKKIDVNSIAKSIENELHNLSESLSEMGDVYRSKRQARSK